MKKLNDYASFGPFISYSILFLMFLLFNSGNLVIKVFAFISRAVAIIYLVVFLDEYNKAKRIDKEGKFVIGILEKNSIKKRYYTRSAYHLKGVVSYYDEQKKMTLHFSGYDIVNYRSIRYSYIEKLVQEEEISVLVGYLPENPTICTIYLKDAIDKYV